MPIRGFVLLSCCGFEGYYQKLLVFNKLKTKREEEKFL